MSVLAINYYIKEDEGAVIKQQDAAISQLVQGVNIFAIYIQLRTVLVGCIFGPTGYLYQVQTEEGVNHKPLLCVTNQSFDIYGRILSKQNLPSGSLLVANNTHHWLREWYMCAVLVALSR